MLTIIEGIDGVGKKELLKKIIEFSRGEDFEIVCHKFDPPRTKDNGFKTLDDIGEWIEMMWNIYARYFEHIKTVCSENERTNNVFIFDGSWFSTYAYKTLQLTETPINLIPVEIYEPKQLMKLQRRLSQMVKEMMMVYSRVVFGKVLVVHLTGDLDVIHKRVNKQDHGIQDLNIDKFKTKPVLRILENLFTVIYSEFFSKSHKDSLIFGNIDVFDFDILAIKILDKINEFKD